MFDFQPHPHLGLILMGGVFAWAGIQHFFHFRHLTGWLASRRWPFPATLLTLGSLLQIAGGGLLIAGVLIPYAAAALIVFTVVANLTLLDFWRQPVESRQTSQNAFTGNIALIGGLLLAACGG
ncbi:MAG TPA: DoxX family protein [Brevundimonas sp.]|nr:DoxX family protein [Brevundimonas sp.]